MASHPSRGDKHLSIRGWSERTQGDTKMTTWNSFSYIYTRASTNSQFSPIVTGPPPSLFAAQVHLHTIHPACPRPTSNPISTYASNTLPATWYSSILSACSNHLNMFFSLTPFLFQLSYAPLHSHLYPLWQYNQTSQTLLLKNIHFPSLIISHTQCLHFV